MKAYPVSQTDAHKGEHVYRVRYRHRSIDDIGRIYPKTAHSLVVRHSAAGRKPLFVMTRSNELLCEESDPCWDNSISAAGSRSGLGGV